MKKNQKITKIQSGFRKDKSTTDNLVKLENSVRNAISSKHHTIIVFLDIEGAYDTAWKHGIIKKLHEYRVRGNMLYFIQNFLHNRKVTVRINDVYSPEKIVTEGIPQGSVLSCTCFLIAINDIADNLAPSVKVTVYADDVALYISGPRPEALKRQLQIALNQLKTWTNKTGFTFSPTKSVTMHICRIRGCNKMSPQLQLNNRVLNHTDNFKYLGLHLDNSLTFKLHINHLRISCIKALNLLKLVSCATWGADRDTILLLYIAAIKPKLDYGCEAYGSACNTYLSSLQPVQNSAIRIATGAYRTSPIISLHAETGIKPLKIYREIKTIHYFLRLKSSFDNSTIQELHCNNTLYERNERLAKPFILRAKNITLKYELNLDLLFTEILPEISHWQIPNLKICSALHRFKKSEYDPQVLKILAIDHLEEHSHPEVIYTDGSKTAEGVGFAHCTIANTYSEKIPPICSIYTAELFAIYSAICHAQLQKRDTTIVTDSLSAIQGLKKYKNNHPVVNKILQQVKEDEIQICLCWVPSHVGVSGNERADVAARQVVSSNDITRREIPRTDFKQHIKATIKNTLENQWRNLQNNKLREIKEDMQRTDFNGHENREWERKLSRLRIGHTPLTHGYLIEQTDRPSCQNCDLPLTVKHILVECPQYNHLRRKHFNRNNPINLKEILKQYSTVKYNGPLYKYLKETRLFYHL